MDNQTGPQHDTDNTMLDSGYSVLGMKVSSFLQKIFDSSLWKAVDLKQEIFSFSLRSESVVFWLVLLGFSIDGS